MDALDAEQQKMLKLTAKGSAARWKLVKTLRDKKAETANATAATSPTSNEAVRELRWPSPLFTFSFYPTHNFWSLRNPPPPFCLVLVYNRRRQRLYAVDCARQLETHEPLGLLCKPQQQQLSFDPKMAAKASRVISPVLVQKYPQRAGRYSNQLEPLVAVPNRVASQWITNHTERRRLRRE